MLMMNQLDGFDSSGLIVIGNVFNDTLTSNVTAYNGYTIRAVFSAAALTVPGGAITQLLVSITTATTEGMTFDSMWVDHKAAAGNAWDFATASPTRIQWAGANGATIGASLTNQDSDACSFVWNKTSGIVVSWHMSNGASDDMRTKAIANTETYYKAAVDEAATQAPAGYSAGGLLYGVSRIRTDGF